MPRKNSAKDEKFISGLGRYLQKIQKNILGEPRQALKARGLSPDTILHFGLGYEPGREPQDQELAKELGMIIPYRKYLAAGRVIIPLWREGKPIWWIGWDYTGQSDSKYVLPAGFEKQLFEYIPSRAGDSCYLVEGVFDFFALVEAGLPVLSPVGTAVSDTQEKHLPDDMDLKVAFDGDLAGRKAGRKLVRRLRESGFGADEVRLPLGTDPADLWLRCGCRAERLEAQLESLAKKSQLHLDTKVWKPCARAYLDDAILPEDDFKRRKVIYALASEFRRLGFNQDRAGEVLAGMWNWEPTPPDPYDYDDPHQGRRRRRMMERSPGQSKQSTSESALTAAYLGPLKASGCNSELWQSTCVGKAECEFYGQLVRADKGSFPPDVEHFLTACLGSEAPQGGKMLKDSDVRLYLAIMESERVRSFPAGEGMLLNLEELEKKSALSGTTVSASLGRLEDAGLVKQEEKEGSKIEICRKMSVPN